MQQVDEDQWPDRVGAQPEDGDHEQRIVCGTLAELASQPSDIFGEPLHSLVIVGKRLHHLEVEYAQPWAVDVSSWRDVAQRVYECSLD